MQTRAPASIRRLIDKHGEAHARLVLCILAEGKGNHALIDETSLSAISDLLLACPDIEGSTSDLLELFDGLPLGPCMAIANELRGTVHQGHALAGMLYLHVRRLREGPLAAKDGQPRQGRPCQRQRDRERPCCVPERRASHRQGEDRDRPPVDRQEGGATAGPFRAVAAAVRD
jgi:hypothetical protein